MRSPRTNGELLQEAYAYCRDLTRERARNFYYGIRLSPEPQRSGLYAIYAWMRIADDLVDCDDQHDDKALTHRIESFRAATHAALAGQIQQCDQHAKVWFALCDTVKRFDIAHRHFDDMLLGQLSDICHSHYQTTAQLLEYCRCVASSVGLVCIQIWGYSDPAAMQLAATRGVAFQLTNILRDVAEDYDHGRTYVPMDEFTRLNLSPEQLRRWERPYACAELIRTIACHAADLYQESSGLDKLINACGQPTLWAMTSIYRGLLDQIIANPERVISGPRVRLSAFRKSAIAFRAKWRARRAASSALLTHTSKATA